MAVTNLRAARNIDAREYIGTNSATITKGDIVGLSGGFATKLGATGLVEGIALETKTFASDNQTVAKAKVNVALPRKGLTFVLTCTSASLAQTDVGKFFVLDSSQVVDYATAATVPAYVKTDDAGAAADAVVGRQVRLVKFVAQNTSEYEFVTLG